MSNSAFTQAQIAVPVAVSNGGLGVSTIPANGQIPIGNGSGYTIANITSTGGTLTFTNGSGTINAEIALAHANTWSGVQTHTAAIITSDTALSIVSTAIATNAALGNYFSATLVAGATTMSAPSNPIDGQAITYELLQPASGTAGTITWNAAFVFGTAGTPTLTVTNAKYDLVGFRYSSRKAAWLYLGSQLGF